MKCFCSKIQPGIKFLKNSKERISKLFVLRWKLYKVEYFLIPFDFLLKVLMNKLLIKMVMQISIMYFMILYKSTK